MAPVAGPACLSSVSEYSCALKQHSGIECALLEFAPKEPWRPLANIRLPDTAPSMHRQWVCERVWTITIYSLACTYVDGGCKNSLLREGLGCRILCLCDPAQVRRF